MACCTVFLMVGQTVQAIVTKANTVNLHLKAAAKWSTTCSPKIVRPLMDLEGKDCYEIKHLLQEQKKWEKEPTWQEPVTADVLMDLHLHATKTNDVNDMHHVVAE